MFGSCDGMEWDRRVGGVIVMSRLNEVDVEKQGKEWKGGWIGR